MPRFHARELVFIAVFAAFAVYVAVEPTIASDDCISIGEIAILLPYYALLYFGTLPALILVTVRRKRDSIVAIGVLCTLLFLEAVAAFPSHYTATASRALDFVPSVVLALWLAKIWLYARVPQDARS